MPEKVNYVVKSSYLLSFLDSKPDTASKPKAAAGKEKKFEDVVKARRLRWCWFLIS